MKIAVIGLGSRGTNYMRIAKFFHKKDVEFTAVCDLSKVKVDEIGKKYKISEENRFTDEKQFFSEKRADAVFICTQDGDHYRNCMQALAVNYNIMVEKPLSFSIDECQKIAATAKEKNVYVVVCHVLRYSNFYKAIKNILRSGELGEIMTVNHQENIANFHYAHSYVRGNWHSKEQTNPILMAKCCHDIDLITWFMEQEASEVSSVGALTYFNKEHCPDGAPDFCYKGCPVKNCPYNAVRLYLTDPPWKAKWIKYDRRVLCGKNGATKKDVLSALKTTDYGRCVFQCGNDVDDHQSVMMKFPGGATATHTLSAFTDKFFRITHITCTNGEIYGEDNTGKLKVCRFDTGKHKTVRTSLIKLPGHIEGDIKLVNKFIDLCEGKLENTDDITFVSATIPSHRTIVRAEENKK